MTTLCRPPQGVRHSLAFLDTTGLLWPTPEWGAASCPPEPGCRAVPKNAVRGPCEHAAAPLRLPSSEHSPVQPPSLHPTPHSQQRQDAAHLEPPLHRAEALVTWGRTRWAAPSVPPASAPAGPFPRAPRPPLTSARGHVLSPLPAPQPGTFGLGGKAHRPPRHPARDSPRGSFSWPLAVLDATTTPAGELRALQRGWQRTPGTDLRHQ